MLKGYFLGSFLFDTLVELISKWFEDLLEKMNWRGH